MANVVKDYKYFDVNAYLNTYFKDSKFEPRVLQNLHKFWKQFRSAEHLKLLEYGGGPNISRLISACPHVEDIIFAEYTESIRKAAEDWVKQNPNAFEWKATFEYIVKELEGQDQDQANRRQAELRQKIRAFVPCDIKANNPLELPSTLPAKYHPPYDVVFTSYCLEAVVESDQEYTDSVAKLAKLVKHGGFLVMHGALQESVYTVGKSNYYSYKLNKELIVDSLQNAGIQEIVVDWFCPEDWATVSNGEGEFFVCGKLV